MVLAAGRGERMRPLTDTTPKPLLSVKGRPLLIHHLYKLATSGVRRVIINLGWLGEQIPTALDPWLQQAPFNRLSVIYSKEPPGALETAGGIRHALHHFEQAPFLLISADILSDLDYSLLATQPWHGRGHLLLVNNPPHHPLGDFVLDEQQVKATARTQEEPTLTYAGIGLFSPTLFSGLEPGWQPLRPILDEAIAQGELTGERFQGAWMDIGDPERLEAAQTLTWA